MSLCVYVCMSCASLVCQMYSPAQCQLNVQVSLASVLNHGDLNTYWASCLEKIVSMDMQVCVACVSVKTVNVLIDFDPHQCIQVVKLQESSTHANRMQRSCFSTQEL